MISYDNKPKGSTNKPASNSVSKDQQSFRHISQLIENSPQLIAQGKFQEIADQSIQAKQFSQLQKIANTAESKLLNSITGAGVVQRVIYVDHTDHNTDHLNRATWVEAQVYGQTLPKNSNNPSTDPIGWTELENVYKMDNHVRMHLWNGRLGGTGSREWNLTPGSGYSNTEMAGEEVNAQRAVDNGLYVSLETFVQYNYTGYPDLYHPSHMKFEWTYSDQHGNLYNGGVWESDLALPERRDEDYDPMDYESYDSDESSEVWHY